MPFSLTEYEDVRVLTVPDPNAPGPATININGWEWWTLFAVQMIMFNAASAAACRLLVQINSKGVTLWQILPQSNTANGQVENMFLGIGQASAVNANVEQSIAIPENFVVGDGAIVVNHTGGDATTGHRSIAVCVAGKLLRPKK
jgi:hypothetical protein